MAKRPQILIMTGENAGRRLDIPDSGLRLGRSSSNDIQLNDEELSRNHCLFEPSGKCDVSIIDLASANGTFVNGEALGAEPRVLKPGDEIGAGTTTLLVVEAGSDATPLAAKPPLASSFEKPAAPQAPAEPRRAHDAGAPHGPVDLGLDGKSVAAVPQAEASRKAVGRTNIIWAIVALLIVGAIALVLVMPPPEASGQLDAAAAGRGARAASPVCELRYERIDADTSHIMRSFVTISQDGTIDAQYNDVPQEKRHFNKRETLSADGRKRLAEIFDDSGWRSLAAVYSGSRASEENRLKSWRICAIDSGGVRECRVENCPEPAAFRKVREALEALLNTELKSWDMILSRDELVARATESEQLADQKWEERNVQNGNIARAIYEYRLACNYLQSFESTDQKRRCEEKCGKAVRELNERYREKKFIVDRAMKIENWTEARNALREILEMLPLEFMPGQDDPRHTEAKAALIDVERRLDPRKRRKGGRK